MYVLVVTSEVCRIVPKVQDCYSRVDECKS